MTNKDNQSFNAIAELIESQNLLAKQALSVFRYEVSEIIHTQNNQNIEHLLDKM
ncbi:MAG: hypothetical protein MUF58_22955 [Arcicella sp.]|jgi:hypothetical protein|nr:hypothetical protein [Arcicella sp.]